VHALIYYIRERWYRRLIFGLVLTVIFAVITVLVGRERIRERGEEELADAIAQTEQTDPDWSWEKLNAKRPVGACNGADLVPQVGEKLPKTWGKDLNNSEWEPISGLKANERFPAAVIAEARKELGAAKDAVAVARRFRDCPNGRRAIELTPEVINTPLQHTQKTREVSALLKWDVVLAIEDGDKSHAADSLQAMLNVSRSLGDEPFMISQLVRIATRILASRSLESALAQVELPADRLAALQIEWAADEREPLLLYGLRGERAVLDVLMQNLIDDRINHDFLNQGSKPGAFSDLAWWHFRSRLPGERAALLRNFQPAIELAKEPVEEQIRHAEFFTNPSIDLDHKMSSLLFPSLKIGAEAYWRSVAETRCLIAALTAERYRLKTGKWPEFLAALTPTYLPAVPLDPYDGQPLRLKRMPDGIVIYSIGPDRLDGGGDLRRAENANGKDEGFRLWDVKDRRKPAPPRPEPADMQNP
jgi:hypothetical protein